jgi:4-amino-4-deoxy-L-arabinose transferase-like glycosyltransferase
MLTKETLIVFPLALPLVFWGARLSLRQALRYLVVFPVATVLVLAPWLIRNYSTFGHVLYTSRTAYIQYELTGTGYVTPYFEEQVKHAASPVSESSDKYDYYQRYGRNSDLWNLGFALNHPATYVRYLFNRLVEFWLHPSGLWSLPEVLVIRTAYIAAHTAMLALAAWQMLIGLRRREAVTGGLMILLAYVTVVGSMFNRPNPRYNLPFLPIIFIYAARGALSLIERFADQRLLHGQRAEP